MNHIMLHQHIVLMEHDLVQVPAGPQRRLEVPDLHIAGLVVDGHSIGVGHPPHTGEAGCGALFEEIPSAHQLQLGPSGADTVLSTVVQPHAGSHAIGTTSPRSKSPMVASREHHEDCETLSGASDSHYCEGISAITPTQTCRESEGDFGGPAQGSVVCLQPLRPHQNS